MTLFFDNHSRISSFSKLKKTSLVQFFVALEFTVSRCIVSEYSKLNWSCVSHTSNSYHKIGNFSLFSRTCLSKNFPTIFHEKKNLKTWKATKCLELDEPVRLCILASLENENHNGQPALRLHLVIFPRAHARTKSGRSPFLFQVHTVGAREIISPDPVPAAAALLVQLNALNLNWMFLISIFFYPSTSSFTLRFEGMPSVFYLDKQGPVILPARCCAMMMMSSPFMSPKECERWYVPPPVGCLQERSRRRRAVHRAVSDRQRVRLSQWVNGTDRLRCVRRVFNYRKYWLGIDVLTSVNWRNLMKVQRKCLFAIHGVNWVKTLFLGCEQPNTFDLWEFHQTNLVLPWFLFN